MEPYWTDGKATLYCGDLRDVLPQFPEFGSFTACVTDPPYHLRNPKSGSRPSDPLSESKYNRFNQGGFMGKQWDGGDVAFRPETWAAVLDALKPGAPLLAFGGTRTFHRMACAIEDGGFEIRDCLSWLYGSGFPKSLDVGKAVDKASGEEGEWVQEDHPGRPGTRVRPLDGRYGDHQHVHSRPNNPDGLRHVYSPASDAAKLWNGWGTALKPAWEPIILAMKPLDGTFAENALRHGVAGLNVDGGRIGLNGEPPPTGSGDCRGRTTYAQDEYTRERMHNGGNTTPAAGRWPANVLLDEEAAAILDEMSGELASGARPAMRGAGTKGYHGWPTGTNDGERIEFDSGGASRFFYVAKAARSERGKSNNHPTVKPLDLMRYLIRLVSYPEENCILDPFAGSGTTLLAARESGCRCVGIELEADHCAIGRDRLKQRTLL